MCKNTITATMLKRDFHNTSVSHIIPKARVEPSSKESKRKKKYTLTISTNMSNDSRNKKIRKLLTQQ